MKRTALAIFALTLGLASSGASAQSAKGIAEQDAYEIARANSWWRARRGAAWCRAGSS